MPQKQTVNRGIRPPKGPFYMSLITTRPTGAPACLSPFAIVSVTEQLQPICGVVVIAAGATVDVDAIPVSDYRGAKWFVSVVNHHNGDVDMYEVYGIHQNGTLPFHTIYSNQGNGVAHTVTVNIAAGNLQLEIMNNEANEILVYLTRTPVPRVTTPTVPLPVNFSPLDVVIVPDTTVPAGQTVTIDSVPFRYHKADKWLLTLLDLPNGKIDAREIFSVNGLAQFTITEYAIVGLVGIAATVNVTASGTTVILQVTNNESEDIAVSGSRQAVALAPSVASAAPTSNCVPITGPCSPDGQECNVLLAFANGVAIPAGNTVVVDQINHVGYFQVKWLLAASDDSLNETMGFQVNMLTNYGNSDFTLYSQIGTLFNIDVNVVTVGLNVNLEITNNEAFPITVDVVRVPVSV